MESLKNTPELRKAARAARAAGRFRRACSRWRVWAAYQLDRLLELHPRAFWFLLVAVVAGWVLAGAAAWWLICAMGLKRGTIMGIGIRGDGLSFPDAMWAAWSAMVSASNHTKEIHAPGRLVAAVVAAGGLLSYSVLTGSISASVKTRMETLRAAQTSRVVEEGHVVVAGSNAHLGTLLEQLSDAHLLAVRDRRRRRGSAQTVLLLNGGSAEQAEGEARAKALAREGRLPRLRVVSRRGDLGAPDSFSRVAAARASKVVLLADDSGGTDRNGYEADARLVAELLALQGAVEEARAGNNRAAALADVLPGDGEAPQRGGGPDVVVEASRRSSAELVERLGGAAGLRVAAVEDLTSKVLVQCARQPGLAKVYRKLMTHTGPVINVRGWPELAGLPYSEARCSFPEAVVCGLVREGGGATGGATEVLFQPPPGTRLRERDQLMLIALKGSYRQPPGGLRKRAAECRAEGEGRDAAAAEGSAPSSVSAWRRAKENVLLLGWRDTCPEMLNELGAHLAPGSEVVVLAQTPAAERERLTASKRRRRSLANIGDLGAVTHLEGTTLSRTDVTRALEATAGGGGTEGKGQSAYSVIVLADTDWKSGPSGGSGSGRPAGGPLGNGAGWPRGARGDARVSFSAALVRELLGRLDGLRQPASLILEVTDRAAGRRLSRAYSGGAGAGGPPLGYISSSEIMALFTSQVVEHSYLSAVWAELLSSYGHEIHLQPCTRYLGDEEEGTLTFRELEALAEARGEVALGFLTAKEGKEGKGPKMRTVVNPVPKGQAFKLRASDRVIVIARRT